MNNLFLQNAKKLFDLSGKVAVVTGAAGGLGRIISLSLVGFGARVVLLGRNRDKLFGFQKEVEESGGEATALLCDVTEKTQVEYMVSEVIGKYGQIDILVNNAGVSLHVSVEDMPLENWQMVLDVNLTGAFLCSKEVVKPMISKKRGKIINISSVRGKVGRDDYASYCASKGGLDSLTRALACEWGKHNIQVNAIAPALFDAGASHYSLADPVWIKRLIERIPLRRWGQPLDLAGAVVFLAAEASNFVNGHILYVDGGYSIAS